MDLTEKFVNMCLKSKILQEIWKPEEFDFVAYKKKNEGCLGKNEKIQIVRHSENGMFDVETMKICVGVSGYHWVVWIPRQDQLFDIIEKQFDKAGITSIMYSLYNFSSEAMYEDDGKTKRFETIEQIMLGYYLKEEYGLYWHEDDWREKYGGY